MNQDVTDYINNLNDKPNQEWQVEVCNQLRKMTFDVIPDAAERLQYGKPHYRKNNKYAAVLSTAKGWVTYSIFNAASVEEPAGFFEAGKPELKTIKILKGQTVDYDLLAKLLKQASDSI